MHRIHINIGSNQGDRQTLIESAVALISHEWPDARLSRSDFFESEPWGFESDNSFINLGLMLETDALINPLDILRRLQTIERRISPDPHRDSLGNYIDRRIDIDLIAVDSLVVNTPELTLPHPRMRGRDFVMKPLRSLDPSWIDPVTGMTADEIVRKEF